jgi:hypothetical protein
MVDSTGACVRGARESKQIKDADPKASFHDVERSRTQICAAIARHPRVRARGINHLGSVRERALFLGRALALAP